jgi:hypothetical protein
VLAVAREEDERLLQRKVGNEPGFNGHVVVGFIGRRPIGERVVESAELGEQIAELHSSENRIS